MAIHCSIKKNTFYDSIQLMRIASEIASQPGINDAAVLMGTNQNKISIEKGELYTPEVAAATANDLFIVVSAVDEKTAREAVAQAEYRIVNPVAGQETLSIPEAYSLESALADQPGSNLALISLAGDYVREEADKALDAGLHLMIFSDNVAVEDELYLKKRGRELGRLVMGPDCGTAIINGAKLAFANEVRRGPIGIVGASGTGIQEVACLIHALGSGISQAIGTGSRDIKAEVGGIMTLAGLELLARDPETQVIAVVSKTPDEEVLPLLCEAAKKTGKPVVFTFLGADPADLDREDENISFVSSLEETALQALLRLGDQEVGEAVNRMREKTDGLDQLTRAYEPGPDQRYVRGLFCGGTLASEGASILARELGTVYSNAGAPGVEALPQLEESMGHTCLDLGDDVFTQGKPHPMIEPSLRHKRIIQEARDPQTAVLLFDVMLGYGSHKDPAGILCESLAKVNRIAEEGGRKILTVAYLCGVDEDPQNYSEQAEKLKEAACILAPSSRAAALLAARYVKGETR